MPKRPATPPDEDALDRALGEASAWLTANVRERRANAGLTQAELAEATGVAVTYIARLEQAEERPNVTLRLLVALAQALGCRPHDLLVPAAPPRRRPPGRPRSRG